MDWVTISFVALLIAMVILIIYYLLGKAFENRLWQARAKSEFYQFAITVFIFAFLIVLVTTAINIGNGVAEFLGYTPSSSDTPLNIAYRETNTQLKNTNKVMNDTMVVAHKLGREASKGASCNFLSVGFSLSVCSSLNSLQQSWGTVSSTVFIGFADLAVQEFLLRPYPPTGLIPIMMSFLVPLGILFRCFQITRRLGGIMIAIGIVFYIVFPLAILIGYAVADTQGVPETVDVKSVLYDSSGDSIMCDPLDPEEAKDNIHLIASNMQDIVDDVVRFVMFRSLLITMFALFVTLPIIQWAGNILGSYIDVSTLVRTI